MPVLAGLMCVALVAGCGSKSDDDAASGDPSTSSTSPSSPASTSAPVPDESGQSDPDAPKQTSTTEPGQSPSSPSAPSSTAAPQPPVTTPAPPPPGPEGTPTSYADALAHFRAASDSVQMSRFETPSHNLYCAIKRAYVPASCELAEGGISDPDYCGPDGPTQVIGRVELDHGKAVPVCNSDTIREPGAKVLPYGTVATAAGSPVQCLAEEIGVTCLNASSQQGFFLARGTYVLLS